MAIDQKLFGSATSLGKKLPNSNTAKAATCAKGHRLMSTSKTEERTNYEHAMRALSSQAGERPVVGNRKDRQVLLYIWQEAWDVLSKSDYLIAAHLFELQSNIIQLLRIMREMGMLSAVGCSRAISASISIAEYRFKALAQELEADEALTITLVKTTSTGQVQPFSSPETYH